MPPTAPPVAAIPVAFPRFLLNQWPITATDGVKVSELAKPPSILNTAIQCQYSGNG